MSGYCVRCVGDGGDLSRLCCLIDNSLSRFHEIVLSRDKERELLVSLSKVLREIQRRIDGFRCPSKDIEEPANDGGCLNLHREDIQFFTNTVSNLIAFLTVKSRYVQHLAGNVLVAISQFIATSGSSWDEFVNFLCVCLEVAIFNALSNSSASSVRGNEILNLHHHGSEVTRVRLKSATWNTVAETLRILHGIIKLLKEEQDRRLVEAFISSLSLTFVNVPWELLNEICIYFNTVDQTTSIKNAGGTESRILFLGNLVQLFCSLVELARSDESKPGSQIKHPILDIVNNLLPEISKLCLDQGEMCHHTRILPYFKHKILVLLMRLAYQLQCNCGTLLSWLQLLHNFYEDLLMKPISRVNHGEDNCLEGSPFLWSLCDQEVCYLSSLHLQRQAVFLFLRCWLSLIGHGELTNSNCACVRLNSISDSKKGQVCSGTRKGFLEFYGWLEVHLSITTLTDNEAYMVKCINFASSFVEFYLHEDDMLFEVLLQLFNVLTSTDKGILKEEDAFNEVELDAFCHLSNIFNPLLLFHVFLAEIKYDHQLLLDYLISKDLGIRFAEYLLRCLRRVCDSWQEFEDLPVKKRVDAQKTHKKRKFSLDFPNPYRDPLPTTLDGKLALSKEHEKINDPERMNSGTRSLHLVKAKTCLLSLKDSLIKLQKRNLFPYDPEVLLKRLKRFDELCCQHG